MSSKRHQQWAVVAAGLLVLVAVGNLLFVDHRRSPVWFDLTLFGVAAVLFLVAYSWIMTVIIPHSVGWRVVASVFVLLLGAVAAAIVSLLWVSYRYGFPP